MRNFLYNKSDILVAAAIIIAALLIIWSRVDAIMDTDNYKSTPPSAAESGKTSENVSGTDADTDVDTDADADANPVTPSEPTTPTEPTTETETNQGGETTEPNTGQSGTFIISAGSASSKIAEDLKAQGFISTTKEFIDMLTKKNVETKVKAGEFTIPAGATVEQIVNILTK
jgi:cytoskeletal protein RodZ